MASSPDVFVLRQTQHSKGPFPAPHLTSESFASGVSLLGSYQARTLYGKPIASCLLWSLKQTLDLVISERQRMWSAVSETVTRNQAMEGLGLVLRG